MKITLANLHEATEKQVFDQVVAHSKTMTERSMRITHGIAVCAYRSAEGTPCFAGCFISDVEYATELEGNEWSTLVGEREVPLAHSALIAELQRVHDGLAIEDWEGGLRSVAKRRGLKHG